MEIKISKWTIFWKALWGGKESVFDYLLDKANSVVAQLPDATKGELERIYANIGRIRAAFGNLEWIVPASWFKYYSAVMRCWDAVYEVLADGAVDQAEISKVVREFQVAYAEWRAE